MLLKRKLRTKKSKSKSKPETGLLEYDFVTELKDKRFSTRLEENKKQIEALFKDSSDFVVLPFEVQGGKKALAVFIDGLVSSQQVNAALEAIMILEGDEPTIEKLAERSIPSGQMKTSSNYSEFLLAVLGGDTGILLEGDSSVLLLGLRGPSTRSVAEPETESVVRGPREGFIENLRTNTSMVRRKLKTPHLKMKALVLGKQTNTNIVISYLDQIADQAVVEEVEKRLQKIDIDAILESAYVEELIEDSVYSPFPQVQITERPDTVAASLLEGRVAIFVDGTPFVLIVPTVFWQYMQASEDYYERFWVTSLVRLLRYFLLVLSLTTPALYVAVTTFHQDLLPTSLMLSIAAAREAIPFPAVIEALLMEIIFESLREAGVRLPKAVGSALGILGALVIGQAAVTAGIVSAPVVIVVSLTGIASFAIPRYNAAIAVRMLRFPLMFLGATFGMYGILLGIFFMLGHMANLRSFGIPYLSPAAPLTLRDMKDTLVRAPLHLLNKRPKYMPVHNEQRVDPSMQHMIIQQSGQKGKSIPHDPSGGKPDETN
ncbi:membrane protein [Paenibacillus swuensis]|uniref:Membrane protein n=1 Tax=Paenibacillus swuensis TaxID=1178515 RepID=A0A172TPJ3_9BACL|nr:spore germination protein [Paenibacillus swuensis]ANE48902.1 membrane protein [Paenibacillus swuensis]